MHHRLLHQGGHTIRKNHEGLSSASGNIQTGSNAPRKADSKPSKNRLPMACRTRRASGTCLLPLSDGSRDTRATSAFYQVRPPPFGPPGFSVILEIGTLISTGIGNPPISGAPGMLLICLCFQCLIHIRLIGMPVASSTGKGCSRVGYPRFKPLWWVASRPETGRMG